MQADCGFCDADGCCLGCGLHLRLIAAGTERCPYASQPEPPPQPASESEKIADLKRQLAGERDHGKRLQQQLDAILRTDGGTAKVPEGWHEALDYLYLSTAPDGQWADQAVHCIRGTKMTFGQWFKKQDYPRYRIEDKAFKANMRAAWNAAVSECLRAIHEAEKKRSTDIKQP